MHNLLLLHIGFVVIVVCYWNKGGGACVQDPPATYRLRELHQQFINISREASKGWRNNNNFGSVYMCVCVCGSGLAISCRRTHTVCVVFDFPVADWMYINRFGNKWRDPTFYRLDFPSTLTKKFHPKVFGFSFLKKFVEIV